MKMLHRDLFRKIPIQFLYGKLMLKMPKEDTESKRDNNETKPTEIKFSLNFQWIFTESKEGVRNDFS